MENPLLQAPDKELAQDWTCHWQPDRRSVSQSAVRMMVWKAPPCWALSTSHTWQRSTKTSFLTRQAVYHKSQEDRALRTSIGGDTAAYGAPRWEQDTLLGQVWHQGPSSTSTDKDTFGVHAWHTKKYIQIVPRQQSSAQKHNGPGKVDRGNGVNAITLQRKATKNTNYSHLSTWQSKLLRQAQTDSSLWRTAAGHKQARRPGIRCSCVCHSARQETRRRETEDQGLVLQGQSKTHEAHG